MADITTDNQFLASDPEVLGLQRQRQLANLLTGQAFNQPQGQMISGYYVPPSALQQALPMINAAIGGLSNANLDTKEQQLASALRQKQLETVKQYASATNPQARLAAALSPNAPKMLQSAAAEMFKPQKLGEGETIQQMNFNTGAFEPMAEGGQKVSPDFRLAMQQLGLNKPLNQINPQELQAINQKIDFNNRSKANNISINTGQHGFDNALKLRSDFRSEPIYKGFEEIKAAKNQIDQAATMASPAGDLAAATKIMKILDPGSVVRESELGMAMSAAGLGDKLGNYAQMIISGQKLTPDQRKDFVALSDKLYNSAAQQYNAKRQEYSGIAEANGLSVEAAAGKPAQLKEVKQNAFGIMPSALDAELKRRGL